MSILSGFSKALDNFASHLTCSICNQVMKDPTTITECGHHFCRSCIEPILGTHCACPSCSQPARIKHLARSPAHRNITTWLAAMKSSLAQIQSCPTKAWPSHSLSPVPEGDSQNDENEMEYDLPTMEDLMTSQMQKPPIEKEPQQNPTKRSELTSDLGSHDEEIENFMNANHTARRKPSLGSENEKVNDKKDQRRSNTSETTLLSTKQILPKPSPRTGTGTRTKTKTKSPSLPLTSVSPSERTSVSLPPKSKYLQSQRTPSKKTAPTPTSDGIFVMIDDSRVAKKRNSSQRLSLTPTQRPSRQDPSSRSSSSTVDSSLPTTKDPSFADLVAAGLILPGTSAQCFDCSAQVTSRGTLLDDIDLLEYVHPFEWLSMLSRTLRPNEPKPTKMDSWQQIRVGGRPLADYKELYLTGKRAGWTRSPSTQTLECSGLDADQKTLLAFAANSLTRPNGQRFHFSLESNNETEDFEPNQHLVVTTNSKGLVVKRTLKYLEAILKGHWIISFDWVLESLKSQSWLLEAVYLAQGDSIVGPSKACQRCSHQTEPLFSGLTFYLDSREDLDWRPPRSELSRLIMEGGGKDISLKPKPLYTLVLGQTLLTTATAIEREKEEKEEFEHDKSTTLLLPPPPPPFESGRTVFFVTPRMAPFLTPFRAPQLKAPLKYYVLTTPTQLLDMISMYQTFPTIN